MSAKLIFLMPHYVNYPLRLINQEIMANMPDFDDYPSESECKPPDGLVDTPSKYEPLPTPPDS